MAGLHFLIAAILVGIGVYSIITTSRNNSAGCKGTSSCGDCSFSGCSDGSISGDGSRLAQISPGAECLTPAGQPRKVQQRVSIVRVR